MINTKQLYFTSLALIFTLAIVACDTTIAKNDVPSEENIIVTCTEPRPQICTNEYKPVCATLENNKQETYATGCTACADKFVLSYRNGVCE